MTAPVTVKALKGVSETLLIPLAARAAARSKYPELGFSDPEAERIAGRIDANLSKYQADDQIMRGTLKRAAWFDRTARMILERQAGALVAHLGCGLDTRFSRLDALLPGRDFRWIDIDLPEVMQVRAELMADTARCRSLAADIARDDWIAKIGWTSGTPVIAICEGVVMYLTDDRVRGLFARTAQSFAGHGANLSFLFDYCSPAMAATASGRPLMQEIALASRSGPPPVSSMLRGADIREADPRWTIVSETDECARLDLMSNIGADMHKNLHAGRLIWGLVHAEIVDPKS